MPPSADVVCPLEIDTASHQLALISWSGSLGSRACPLATFGSREPQELNVRLACAEPPRADQPELENAAELQGAIALVVRGGCSFAHKARLLQRAGAVAMLLANNTREEPLAAFTMGESPEEIADTKKKKLESITIPCVMMCLRDVRELFQKFPPSVKNGELCFKIFSSNEGAKAAETCIKVQRELHDAIASGKGWKAIKWTTLSFIKFLESHHITDDSIKDAPSLEKSESKVIRGNSNAVTTQDINQPLLAFVQWATSASTYEICFAPLADFCSTRAGASYAGRLVPCDPLVADRPLKNAEYLMGAIALLRRGSCSFPEKLARVQRAGAVAAIISNDDEEDLDAAFVMSVDHIDAANATLPAVMISHKTFLRIQAFVNVTTARILCLAGQAVNGLVELNGQSVSFRCLSMPIPRQALQSGKETSSTDDIRAFPPDLVFHLHMACRNGDYAACQHVLASAEKQEAKYQLVNTSCPSTGVTALHQACAGGNDMVVELLLRLGAAPNALDLAMQTPLHVACAENHAECARLLLRAEALAPQAPAALYNRDEAYGGLPARPNIGGGTAMHEAARAGSSECVELLLSANARVEHTIDGASDTFVFFGASAKDVEGNTPLHVACANAHATCALYLVAAWADVNGKNFIGQSPLLLACEAANEAVNAAEAVRIISKLIKAGAGVEECDEKSQLKNHEGSDRLLLDRIKSADLRRDIEILYVRHEAHYAKQKNLELESKNERLATSIQELKKELRSLRNVVHEHMAHGSQVPQLQVQMQMSSQCPTNDEKPTFARMPETIVPPRIAETSEPSIGKSDEDLALDAALARDLGKKCLRQSQSVLAETHFQHSLELMPLPGVRRLLVAAQNMQHADSTDLLMNQALTMSCTTCTILTPEMPRTLQSLNAAKSRKIIEMSRSVARQIEVQQRNAIDVERRDAHRNQAVRTIQSAFRECYAIHQRARVVAAVKIQGVIREKLARLHNDKRKKLQHLRAYDELMTVCTTQQNEVDGAALLKVDYTRMTDPLIKKKLPSQYAVVKLIVGRVFPARRMDNTECTERNMRIVQLLKCVVEANTVTSYRTKVEKAPLLLFVWTRGEGGLDKMCTCVLSGPYENQQDAQRRFHRIVCEVEMIDAPIG